MTLSGQVETMRESFDGLFSGMALAVGSRLSHSRDQFSKLGRSADRAGGRSVSPWAGSCGCCSSTQTHLSVPALMGSLMCIGLTSANSILVVTFANQRMEAGDDKTTAAIIAGYTRLRPVMMTAGAMILGMIPMALGVGEGGEQNAPLARAVIGGLMFATVATLIFVPVVYRLLRSNRQPASHFAAARRPRCRRISFPTGPRGDDMKPEDEILDPYCRAG